MSNRMKIVTLSALAAVLALGTATAEAKSCKSKKHGCTRDQYSSDQDRRSASEREFDHIRARSVDPGGSYEAYPDWARYALSPKSGR